MSHPLKVGDTVIITDNFGRDPNRNYTATISEHKIISFNSSNQNIIIAYKYGNSRLDCLATYALVKIDDVWQVIGLTTPHAVQIYPQYPKRIGVIGSSYIDKYHQIDFKDFTFKHFGQLMIIANDPKVMYFVQTEEVWSDTYIRSLITYSEIWSGEDCSYIHKAILSNDNLIGYIGLRPYRDTNNPDDTQFSELLIFLDKPYQGKGRALSAYNLLIEYLKNHNISKHIIACINSANQPAASLIVHLGFKFYKSIIRKQELHHCYVKYYDN